MTDVSSAQTSKVCSTGAGGQEAGQGEAPPAEGGGGQFWPVMSSSFAQNYVEAQLLQEVYNTTSR